MDDEQRLYELHAKICQTLAHPRRLMIINALRDGEKTVNQLVEITGIAQASISRHLATMRPLGVVIAQRAGQNVFYRLGSPNISQAYDVMHAFALEYLESRAALVQFATR